MSYSREVTETHKWSCDSCGAEFVSSEPPSRLVRVTVRRAGLPAVELDLCYGCTHRPLFDHIEHAALTELMADEQATS
jgi:hypothetical protein